MKTFNLNTIYLFALAVVFSFGCNSTPKAGYYVDNDIPESIRNDFHQRNKDFFDCVKTNYQVRLKGILSQEMLRDKSETTQRLDHIKHVTDDYDYTLFKEFYVVNKWRSADTIPGGKGVNDFNLRYLGITKEMYFALYLPKTGDDKEMITVTYCKFDYGWRIFTVETMPYSVNGKTTPELYDMSKKQREKGYLSDAVTTMAMAMSCSEPNTMWDYSNDQEMTSYYSNLMDEANKKLKFPIKVKSMVSPISIFRVYDQRVMKLGTYPTVCYLTKINIKDTAAVRKENILLRKQIGKTIPGIDKDKKYLLYSAYNKAPGSQFADHFDMTDKLQ